MKEGNSLLNANSIVTYNIFRQKLFSKFILVGVLFSLFWILALSASATNCATYSTQATCTATDCNWKSDPWGSWCEQKGCWNLFDQTSCGQSNNASSTYYLNKYCNWRTGTTTGWCNEVDCWSFDGTDRNACESNTAGLKCSWVETYNANTFNYPCMGPPEKQCWSYQTNATCSAVTGCNWGTCKKQSCMEQTTSAACIATPGFNNVACKWNSQYSYCYESGCWDYTNKTACESSKCTWSGGSCYKPSCYDYGNKNATYCVNNTAGLTCNWNNPWCEEKGCWNYVTSPTCTAANSSSGKACKWQTSNTGWCEERGCWNWDSNNGGSQSSCSGNSTTYSLNCTWNNNTATVADLTDGWCYENIASKDCTDIPTQRECSDSMYCFWNQTSSLCQNPTTAIQTDYKAWYPGCYIFDFAGKNTCQNVSGCSWSAGNSQPCQGNATISSSDPTVGGIRCQNINDSDLCTNMVMLPHCCKWQGGTCVEDKFTTICWDQMQNPPEGAAFCEDYNAFTDKSLCENISSSPWYMPCKWNNDSERCQFKNDNIFTAGKENLIYIDNKKNCEVAGGKWVTDQYCSTNDPTTAMALSTGKCESKFDEERNCDKQCFACNYKTDGKNWTSAATAKDACINSLLGSCKFTSDSTAPNNYGYCTMKDEFKKGLVSDCNTDCGSCTYMGDSTSAEAEKRPSSHCKNSKAKCRWISNLDSKTDESKGRCGTLAEKTCEDKCDLCTQVDHCVTYGGKKGNTTMDTQCSWSSVSNTCTSKSGGDQMEICWNGADDNSNGKTDCADSMCYSDPFCGGGFMGTGGASSNCFIPTTQSECESSGCSWTNENWGSWCDMAGSKCWKKDGNATACQTDGNCTWHSGFGGLCEENFTASNTCMNLGTTDCNAHNDCTWVSDQSTSAYSGWCDPHFNYTGSWYNCMLHDIDGQSICENAGTADVNGRKPCKWFTSGGGSYAGGWCDNKKFACAQFKTQEICESTTNATYNHSLYCKWNSGEYGSFCDSKTMNFGTGSCWSQSTQPACTAAGCNWKSGFCDPVGFGSEMGFGGSAGQQGGAVGGSGMNCMKYDGNQTGCENQTGCGWFSQSIPFCDVEKSGNCPQYSYNGTICDQQSKCRYNPQGGNGITGGFCDEKPFECNWNNTLQQNLTACGANSLCSNASNRCDPICFTKTTSQTCSGVTGCKWMSGWCNPAMAAQFFKGMEGGAPIPLGFDASSDATPPEVDIVDFGMKDMGKSFGFGIRVNSLQYAAMCNGMKLTTGAGTGKNTTTYHWYIDTDGTSTNNCNAKDNASLSGFEFHFKDSWSWNNVTSEAVETTETFVCVNNTWQKAPIPISSVKQKACQEIGGGMIAVEKAELEKFPDLYTAGNDMRIYVTTANATSNSTSPSDVANIGWLTPGTVDFDLDSLDLYKYKTNTSEKSGEGMDKGYVSYSDVDCWTETGCADYQCEGHPYCVNKTYGVEASGFSDTRTPKLIGFVKEMYPDAAFITYFTDKPSNGTLELYGPGDPTCTQKSTANFYGYFHDIGILSNKVRNYKLLHMADLRLGATVYYANGSSAAYPAPLASNATLYYKIVVCDNTGKCGSSKCTLLMTETTVNTCPFCNLVAKIDVPTGWNVSYDLDGDGAYDHTQGQVCGLNAGMKVNYTTGRNSSIKLYESDNSSYIEFKNVRLTKTGLGRNTRDLNDVVGSLSASTSTDTSGKTFGYAGMIEDTRDRIVNNLFPEMCFVKIPQGTKGCTELWHCNNALTKCLNRTAEAKLNETGTDYCVWEVPYCEFSTWGGGQPSTGGGNSPGGGGGSGLKNVTATTPVVVVAPVTPTSVQEAETPEEEQTAALPEIQLVSEDTEATAKAELLNEIIPNDVSKGIANPRNIAGIGFIVIVLGLMVYVLSKGKHKN